uniref:BTB domain-containing protein n=1 Tax=Ditylenchus dipsaci TaxID=166011 RepID=A0A915D9N9_9BILA
MFQRFLAISKRTSTIGLGQMEAMINDKFVDISDSIQKTWSENKATMMENYLKISELVLEIQTLVAEKKKTYCHQKSFLRVLHVLQDIVFGRFREKDQDEIELKEVCAEEFLQLLKVIYPPKQRGNPLRSADRYQVKSVLDRCSQYLKKCAISEVPLQDKLMYAQSYGLSELFGFVCFLF